MSLDYAYRLRVTRAGAGGGQDPVTGMPTGSAADVVIYDGPADWQDATDMIATDSGSMVRVQSVPTTFLPRSCRRTLFQMTTGDTAQVFHPDRGIAAFADGEIGEIRDMDTAVTIRRRA